MHHVIRPLTSADEALLWDMLYQGLRTGEGEGGPAPDVVHEPELARFVKDWGQPNDAGFVAHDPEHDAPVGAVWFRSTMSEATVEAETDPDLALAVRPGYRRRGIGASLLTQWVKANPQLSRFRLRVPSTSPAVRLYERFGFRVVDQSPHTVTMRREIPAA